MDRLIRETQDWIERVCPNHDHLVRTVHWVKKLIFCPTRALLIAALTHDIERSFNKGRKPPKDKKNISWDDLEYCLWHGRRSAEFVVQFLKKKRAPEELIEKVSNLIVNHEIGGTREANLVKDADSISFLEINVPLFISFVPEKMTKESVREKFGWMFSRISYPNARNIARPFYKKAIESLAKK